MTSGARAAAIGRYPSAMRWIFVSMWVLLVADLALWSPPPAADQGVWVQEALLGQWDGKNPATVALFNLMGLWPLAFAGRLSAELRARPIPAWPFVLGSMVIGAFALLPYFVAQPRPPVGRAPWRGLRWLQHPAFLPGIGLLGLGMAAWGLAAGDLGAFWDALRSEQLVQVMSLDFVVLAITFGLTVPRAAATDRR